MYGGWWWWSVDVWVGAHVHVCECVDGLSQTVAKPQRIGDVTERLTLTLLQVLRTVSMFCTVASGVTLMVVAVERYKRICTPLRKQISPRGAQVVYIYVHARLVFRGAF